MDWKSRFDPDSVTIKQVPSIINGSGLKGSTLSANPYIGCPHSCMYCYVPGMKNGPASDCGYKRWGTYLTVKEWFSLDLGRLRKHAGDNLVIGSSTDPYNPLEPHFRRTRTLLEELEYSGLKISIITKSDLVTQDLGMLSYFGDNVMVAFSINTLDEKFKDDMDAAPSIQQRLKAMRACKDMGILTACFIAPVFPGITNVVAIIETVRNHCDAVWVDGLNLSKENLGRVTGYVSAEYSYLFPLYRRMFRDGDLSHWMEESNQLQEYTRKERLEYSVGKIEMNRAPLGQPVIVDYMRRRGNRK